MKLIKKVLNVIAGWFTSLEKQVEKFIPIAVNVTEAVKAVVENRTTMHVLELVKFIIPGNTDDKIIDKVISLSREYIPRVALQLQIINSISGIEDPVEKVEAVINEVKKLSKTDQSKYWHEFAKQVLYVLADGKITWGEAAMLVEYHYQNYIKR